MKYKNFFNNVYNKLKTDLIFRTYITSTLSFFITIIFTFYNMYLGIAYHTTWNYCIAIYYLILVFIRAYIFYLEKKAYKLKYTNNTDVKTNNRNLYLCILLFLIDLSLLAPVTLMVMQKKSINYTTIPAIVNAAYTTFKIIMASKSFIKLNNNDNFAFVMLKKINLKDAFVSILSLQYILTMTFSKNSNKPNLTLTAVTSFIIWLILLIISILTLVKAIKTINKKNS